MSLSFNRASLKYQLLGGTAFNEDQQATTLRLMNKWWDSYKIWEGHDRFLAAFKEGRMTIRQAPGVATTYGEFEGKKSDVNFSVNRGTEGKVNYPKERYRVDVGAMRERLNPANFGRMEGGERLKYKRGLHDLSASLCVPSIPLLTKQMRWKPTNVPGKADNWITVFMPMAQPEDMELFSVLNSMAKLAPQAIRLRVAEMRRRMSRIMFADSVDIGAGLRDNAAPGSDPKFRYGQTSPLSHSGNLTGQDLLRAQKALNYPSILPKPPSSLPKTPLPPPIIPSGVSGSPPPPPSPPGGPGNDGNVNEVVVAYREHEGVRFPLFTQYDNMRGCFHCLKDDPSSYSFPEGRIPNHWARTVEV